MPRKLTSKSLGAGSVTSSQLDSSVNDTINNVTVNTTFSGTHIKVPVGTTAQRPVSPTNGMLRFNTTIGKLEQYDGNDWAAIDAPPVVTSITPSSEIASDDPQSIVISGSNFSTVVSVKLIGNNGAEYTPTTVTRNSSSQVTITFVGNDRITGANEPYDVKVVNASGLSSVLENALNINDVPTWVTASGSVGTVVEDVTMSNITLSATDPESVGITYTIASGALPSGTSLASNGVISGTPNVNDSYNSSGVTHNFTVAASDGSQSINRSFSILRKWRDGSTAQLAVTSAKDLTALGITTNGNYYMSGPSGIEAYPCVLSTKGGGWQKVVHIPNNTNLNGDEYWNGTYAGGGSYGSGITGASGTIGASTRWYRYPSYWSTDSSGSNLDLMVTAEGYGSGTITNESMIGSIFRNIRLDLSPFDVPFSKGTQGASVSQTGYKSNDGINFTSFTATPNLSSGWLMSFATDGGVIGYNSSNGGFIVHENSGDNIFTRLYAWVEGTGVVGSNTSVTAVNFYIRVR